MSKLFSVHGLHVSATPQQVDEYIADATQYDYIKNSLELIAHKVEPTCKDGEEFIHAFRLGQHTDGSSKYLIAMTGKGDKHRPTFMVYSPATKSFTQDVPVDMLTCMRNEQYVESAADRLSKEVKTTLRQLPEACETMAYDIMAQNQTEPEF